MSLVAGLNGTHVGPLIGEIDDLPPDERGYLLGLRLATRLGARVRRHMEVSYVHDLVAGTVNETQIRSARVPTIG